MIRVRNPQKAIGDSKLFGHRLHWGLQAICTMDICIYLQTLAFAQFQQWGGEAGWARRSEANKTPRATEMGSATFAYRLGSIDTSEPGIPRTDQTNPVCDIPLALPGWKSCWDIVVVVVVVTSGIG